MAEPAILPEAIPSTNDQVCITFPGGAPFHLGYSRISKYTQCPKQYKYSYVDKIKTPSGLPLRRGQAYHGAVEFMLQYKIDNKELLPLDKAERIAIRTAKAEDLTTAEIYRVIDAVRFYHSELYHLHQPKSVEEDFDFVRHGIRFTGRIDLIEDQGIVTDHKFSYDTWADSRAKYGCQPVIYQWAAEDIFEKRWPDWHYEGFEYNIIRLYPSPVIQKIRINRISRRDSDWWEEQIYATARAIRLGIFPAIASDKNCQYCDFKKLCNPVVYKIHKSNIGEVDYDAEDI